MATMQYLRYPVIGTGSGTVTSVGLALPGSVFNVTGSPVTTSGTLTGAFISQSANTVFAAPNGSSGVPSFRLLVAADIPALSYVTSVTASSPLFSSGGQTPNITIQQSTTAQDGYLSSTDWNTFNNKQPAGSYITALTGDATASGPGSAALTLATVNGSPSSFGTASSVGSFTVNGKGLVTASSNTSIQIAESQVTNLVSDLAGKQATGNYITALTGDVTAAGPGSVAATLANVGTAGTYVKVTTNAKGLVTSGSASPQAVADGGTSLSTLTANNVILGNGSSAPLFVAPGTSGNLLTSNGMTWQSTAPTNPFDSFVSNGTSTQSSGISSMTYTTFDNSPAFTFTPNHTANYKIYTNAPIYQGVAGNYAAAQIILTSGSGASLLSNSSGTVYATALNLVSIPLQVTYSLTAGTSYQFDIQGMASVGGTTYLGSTVVTFYMYAERIS